VVNLICLNETLKNEILNRIKLNWKNLFVNKLPKNRNEILFCCNQEYEEMFVKNAFNEKNENPNNKDGHSMNLFSEISKTFKKLEI
jgi:hypothetical protein